MSRNETDPAVAACVAASRWISLVNDLGERTEAQEVAIADALNQTLAVAFRTPPRSFDGMRRLVDIVQWEARQFGVEAHFGEALASLAAGVEMLRSAGREPCSEGAH